jgi:hypothetical protein
MLAGTVVCPLSETPTKPASSGTTNRAALSTLSETVKVTGSILIVPRSTATSRVAGDQITRAFDEAD